MTPIDTTHIQIPEGWQGRANAAEVAVDAATDRHVRINQLATVWGAVKGALGTLSNDKCWYCEAKRCRDDFAVDHFRPKNAVSVEDCPNHPGYWWLAFNLNNFRYSCTLCNSKRRDLDGGHIGGKQDRFPILNGQHRAMTPADDLAAECPMLLDPLIASDVALLYFEIDGRVLPSTSDGTVGAQRADISISLYHLNHSSLKRARRRLYSEIQRVVEEGDVYFGPGLPDARVDHARQAVLQRIIYMVAPEHEFLGAVRSFLAMFGQANEREWLKVVLA